MPRLTLLSYLLPPFEALDPKVIRPQALKQPRYEWEDRHSCRQRHQYSVDLHPLRNSHTLLLVVKKAKS